MKTNMLAGVFGLAIVLVAQAQPMPGEYNYGFSNGMLPLYDMSISAATNIAGIDEQFFLDLSPKGRFSGSFAAYYDDGIVELDVSGSLSGRLSSAPSNYQIVFAGHGPLSGTAYGRPIRGSHSFRARLDADPATGVATGTETVRVCLAGYGCESMSEQVTFDIFEQSNSEGDWSLALNITNKGNTISGSAQAMLSNGRTADFRVRGTYSRRLQTTQLTLRGTGAANGVLIKLTTDSAMQLRSVRGKLFGQRLNMTPDSSH